MEKTILMVSGSPTKKGNCEFLLEGLKKRALDQGFKVEEIRLSQSEVKPCTDCGFCREKFECSVHDDMNKFYPLLEKATAVIFITPTFFGSLSGQLKCFLDRTLLFRRQGFKLKDKVGAAIAVGGSRNGGQELAIQALQAFMHIQGMIPVGDNSHFGGILWKPVKSDHTGLKTAEETLNKVIQLLNSLK